MNKNLLLSFFMGWLFLTSCHNKYICPECDSEKGIMIKFNWDDVDQISDGMKVYFYNTSVELDYSFNVSSMGERINIKPGTYTIFCHNNDTEYVNWRGQSNKNTIEAYTRNATLEEDHTRLNENTQEMVVMPDYLCGQTRYSVDIPYRYSDIFIIEMIPHELVDVYTYEVLNVINAQNITKIRATLTGVSSTLFPCNPEKEKVAATIPFMGNVSHADENLIEGKMINFGFVNKDDIRNLLTVYFWSPNGNVKATFDVTKQVQNAPNPMNVLIVVEDTIQIPKEIGNDNEGFSPNIDEWKELHSDIVL